jgi:hypothetical protein
MSRPAPRFKDALDVLSRHGVDFIVVGGVAAVLAGAPISTFDLDIVPARSHENLVRLVAALGEIDARYRDLTGRILRPEVEGLAGPGHHLLLTTCGPVDVLGTIGQGDGYDQLLADVVERAIGEHRVMTLGLASLIRTKEAAGREKDRAVLAILRRTLEESTK